MKVYKEIGLCIFFGCLLGSVWYYGELIHRSIVVGALTSVIVSIAISIVKLEIKEIFK